MSASVKGKKLHKTGEKLPGNDAFVRVGFWADACLVWAGERRV